MFSLFGQRYQVGVALARKKVVVHYDPDDLAQVDVWSGKRFQERVRPLSPGPHRRPVAPIEPDVAPQASDARPSNPWVDHLLASGRPARPEEDPVDVLLADHARMNEQVLELVEGHVLPEVFDRAKVMDFLERYGPFDPGAVEECLTMAVEFGGPDQHLDPLLADLRSALEVL